MSGSLVQGRAVAPGVSHSSPFWEVVRTQHPSVQRARVRQGLGKSLAEGAALGCAGLGEWLQQGHEIRLCAGLFVLGRGASAGKGTRTAPGAL